MPILDLHAHVIPGESPATLAGSSPGCPHIELSEADVRELVVGPARFRLSDVWYAAEARLEAMDANGVDAEAVSPMPLLLHPSIPATEERDACRWVNDFVAGLCAAGEGRMYGLGQVPLQDPDMAAGLLDEVDTLGLKGVEVATTVAGSLIGDARFVPFFAEAERRGLCVLVHALPQRGGPLPPAAMPTFAVGVDATLGVASMITGGTIEACPDVRVAFTHGGGGTALVAPRAHWFWGRTWNEEPSDTAPEGPSPTDLARRLWYDTLVFDRRAIRFLVDLIGADRLLVGTDFPAMPREQPIARSLRSMDLPADVVDAITWRNAFRFLGMDAPDGAVASPVPVSSQAAPA